MPWIGPGLVGAFSFSELMVVPGGVSPISITLPVVLWVDEIRVKWGSSSSA